MEKSTTDSITLTLQKFFELTAAQYHIEMVFLYGSLASGHPRGNSDVDLAILFSDEINKPEEIYSLIVEITYKVIRELNREANVMSIDKDFDHPMLYYNVIVSGIPIYIKDNDKFLNLKLEAIYQMEDFQIYGVGWQKEIATKIMQEVTDARI